MLFFNKKNNETSSLQQKFYKALFFQEEINGDKLVNYIRMIFVVLLTSMVLIKADVLTGHFKTSRSFYFTMIIMGIAALYSVILFFFFRKNIYHAVIKYISTFFDLTLIILSIYSYKLDSYEEYGTIFFLGRTTLIVIFISFSFLRYSFRLAVFAGLTASLEYFFLVIYNNHFTGLKFWFTGADGGIYYSVFSERELYFRAVYILVSGFVIGIFALRFKNLVKKSIEREHDRNKLMMDNKIIDTINKESKKYLDNIAEGLLIINKFFAIKGHYSKKLVEIFETNLIEGENIVDLIFPDKNSQTEKRREFENFLNILFSNTSSDMDMIMDINPVNAESIYVEDHEGMSREKIISARYNRIIKNDAIEEIMIIITDRTEIIKAGIDLANERAKHTTELEYISAILKTDTDTLKLFFQDSHDLLSELELNTGKLDDMKVVNHFFRQVHSLKGNARTFELNKISELANEIESCFADIRDNKIKISDDVLHGIRSLISSIYIEFDDLKKLHDRFKKVLNSNVMASDGDREGRELKNFFNTLENMTEGISKELNKKTKLMIDNRINDLNFLNKVKNPIVHLIRNAIDHGIEDNFERLSRSKDETGEIKLKLFNQNNGFQIELSDDGSGIDFNRILKKAKEKNLVSSDVNVPDRNKLLQFIFTPGFTTKDKAGSVSGRGVGLDAVKEDIVKLKGKIKVVTESGKGTKFIISVPEK